MTKEDEELEKRFGLIQAYVVNLYKVLPDEFDSDFVDARYFELFLARKFNSDRGRYSEDDEIEFKKKYLAKYKSDKRSYALNKKVAEINLKHRMTVSTLLAELTKNEIPYTVQGSMIKVFELIGALLCDEVSARLLKENLLPVWHTGCINLSKEEKKEIIDSIPKRVLREGETDET